MEWGVNGLFWLVTAWFIMTTFGIVRQEIEIINGVETVRTTWNGNILTILSVLLVLCALMFYFNLWNISRLNGSRDRTAVTGYLLGAFAACFLGYQGVVQLPYLEAFPRLSYGLIVGIMLFYFAVSFGYGISKVWWRGEAQRRQLILEKKQAELDLLRSQLQPHFLFNVLNNLLAMVDQQQTPTLASAIDRLSGLLRHVVYDSGQQRVPVAKEIDFIRHYAELQLLRFETGEVQFNMSVAGAQPHWVEPGIFLPFVENAFKHGAAPETQSTIAIHFDLRAADVLIFKVCNSILPELPPARAGGTGLAATRDRLKLVYPATHVLSIEENEKYRVTLELMDSNDLD